MVGKTAQVVIRLEPELLALAEEVAELTEQAGGLERPSRASILRAALRKGLEAMQADLKRGKRRKT